MSDFDWNKDKADFLALISSKRESDETMDRVALLQKGRKIIPLDPGEHRDSITDREVVEFIVDRCGFYRTGPFTRVEPLILDEPYLCWLYAQSVVGGRWPEAEQRMVVNASSNMKLEETIGEAWRYLIDILGEPWPEMEPHFARVPYFRFHYRKYLEYLAKVEAGVPVLFVEPANDWVDVAVPTN